MKKIYKVSATRSSFGIVVASFRNTHRKDLIQYFTPTKISLTVLDRSKYSNKKIQRKFLHCKFIPFGEMHSFDPNSAYTMKGFGLEVVRLCGKLDEVVKDHSTGRNFISTKTPKMHKSGIVFTLGEKEIDGFFSELKIFDVETELRDSLTIELPEQSQDRARV